MHGKWRRGFNKDLEGKVRYVARKVTVRFNDMRSRCKTALQTSESSFVYDEVLL